MGAQKELQRHGGLWGLHGAEKGVERCARGLLASASHPPSSGGRWVVGACWGGCESVLTEWDLGCGAQRAGQPGQGRASLVCVHVLMGA